MTYSKVGMLPYPGHTQHEKLPSPPPCSSPLSGTPEGCLASHHRGRASPLLAVLKPALLATKQPASCMARMAPHRPVDELARWPAPRLFCCLTSSTPPPPGESPLQLAHLGFWQAAGVAPSRLAWWLATAAPDATPSRFNKQASFAPAGETSSSPACEAPG